MATRNFYVEAEIDGRKTPLAGGPRAKDGGMRVDINIRNDGNIEHIVSIQCFAAKYEPGTLLAQVYIKDCGAWRIARIYERKR